MSTVGIFDAALHCARLPDRICHPFVQELFLSTPKEERLYIGKRKGFIKLAMRTGSEVIPCYYFGNTTVLEVGKRAVDAPFAADLSHLGDRRV